jgi:hypothetical protein
MIRLIKQIKLQANVIKNNLADFALISIPNERQAFIETQGSKPDLTIGLRHGIDLVLFYK